MTEILIGTSGYFYDDWKGEFYPPGTQKKDFLDFYSRHFRVLELNYSYYRIPQAHQSSKMIARSSGKIEFVIKAFRQMTHEISENSLKEVLPFFMEGILPFIKADKLGAVLLQFPQSFHYIPENRIYLKSLIEMLSPCPVFVEFRQKEWLRESVYKKLRELRAGFVCVDEPPLPSLIPPIIINTSESGYIRFHGRNSKKWYGTDSRTRYDYMYSEVELKEWIQKIKKLAEKTDKLFVFFNNHAKAQAVTNAKMLINLLSYTDRREYDDNNKNSVVSMRETW
ncbi:MAG: DUF72 domain-containing protein [Thermodesulfobacteriota bacterium]|nr:DUF72 domain-containing protein [Thermodesulfobacteriota bacterium]